ncbi:type II toxin-antitoxin system RelE/ParE family toxin [Aliiglaciecola sp. CAU 1673]|uniref:type II toxin-antitoxin system RelE/ParE family toxin n=1 Tax=Aliiglaciecola sp. CAU 1673 TaxID=3032595 RepID=UPI0023DC0072|nr:type II toxin-antitoxin system RelE/ParE family toxin [Aliiglaciecola sp. CAU 1673]MDF2178586.1 type II toxin-antitoxin system RelE/ParE family toxin [Aliiglaciecola sp. CAU 1673]
MASYKLSKLAEEDLRLISTKTIEEWGRSQAQHYVALLHQTLTQITNTPDIGKSRPELFESARSFPAQKHVVYYRKSEDGIEVARILHQRMDVFASFE